MHAYLINNPPKIVRIPVGRVKPQTINLVLVSSPLNTQHKGVITKALDKNTVFE
jgi:hypothetical protein